MKDVPSLATADASVMMSNGPRCLTLGGSVLLLQPQLDSIHTLLDIVNMTMNEVFTNFMWAIVYNDIAVAFVVGLGALLNLHISP